MLMEEEKSPEADFVVCQPGQLRNDLVLVVALRVRQCRIQEQMWKLRSH